MRRLGWMVIELLGSVFWLIGCWGYAFLLVVGSGLNGSQGGLAWLILPLGGVIGLVPLAVLISRRVRRDERLTPLGSLLRWSFLILALAGALFLYKMLAYSGDLVDVGRYSAVSGTVTGTGIDSGDASPREIEGYVWFEDPLDNPPPRAYRFHDFTNQTLAPKKNLMLYVRDGDQIRKSFFSNTLTLIREQQVSRWNYVPQPPARQ